MKVKKHGLNFKAFSDCCSSLTCRLPKFEFVVFMLTRNVLAEVL